MDQRRQPAPNDECTSPMHPGYTITADRRRIDLAAVHAFLARSYWSPGIPRATIERAIDHSMCFSLLHATEQVGFARVITDRTTFAYLADVYVLEAHRGKGLGKWLVATILQHADLQGLRRFMLATRDAHRLYGQFGFRPIASPARLMEMLDPDVYKAASAAESGPDMHVRSGFDS
jgi:N-acetylglutamate synthase-like GNAT family acetyltransferase